MKKRIKVLGAIVVALLVLLPTTAWGHTQTRLDPDDTPGPLDLVVARHSHRTTDSGGIVLRFRAVTYETWEDSVLEGPGGFAVEFNLPGGDPVDRCLLISRREVSPGVFRLQGSMFKRCIFFEELVGITKNVSRPDEHSLRISLPIRFLGKNVHSYRWRMASGYEDEKSKECKPPHPHVDGGYGSCSDYSAWTRHAFQVRVDDD